MMMMVIIIIIIIIRDFLAQFDTDGILTALYIVIKYMYIQTHHRHICMGIYSYTGLLIYT